MNTGGAEGRTPLVWAVARLSLEAVSLVKMLLEHDGIHAYAADNKGWAPLFMAASLGSAELVNVFLQHDRGVDVNAEDNGGKTPLSWAAARGLQMLRVVKMGCCSGFVPG